jgi:hypothetical protein
MVAATFLPPTKNHHQWWRKMTQGDGNVMRVTVRGRVTQDCFLERKPPPLQQRGGGGSEGKEGRVAAVSVCPVIPLARQLQRV